MAMHALILTEIQATRPLKVFPEIHPEDDLRDDLELDSLDLVSIAMGLETALHIDLPDCVIAKRRCVGDIATSVERARHHELETPHAD